MFPLRDKRPVRIFPVVTFLIIFANALVFLWEFLGETEYLIDKYALIPSKVDFGNFYSLIPFVSSQFLHAGLFHIISNMWFLKIFGDNVEEETGVIVFIFLYIFSGAAGAFCQYLFTVSSDIPMLGASGSVAGVLGAYLVFFPREKIETLIPLGIFVRIVEIPSSIMLVYWFLLQIFSGVGSFIHIEGAGVAWWAHVGGFVSGYVIALLFRKKSRYAFS